MDQVTVDLLSVMQAATVGAFVVLMWLSLVRAPGTGATGWWAASAFASVAVALSMTWAHVWLGFDPPEWVDSVSLLLLLAFPYLLFRFAATFGPFARVVEMAVAGVTVVAAGLVSLLVFVGTGELESMTLASSGVLVYWVGVSSVTVGRLWRAGRAQPGVARSRMRVMAVAAAALAAALLVAVELEADGAWAEPVAYGLALISAIGFALGFRPPLALRLWWRRQEDAQVETVVTALLGADTREQVLQLVLPSAMQILAASDVALVGLDGTVVARHGGGHAPRDRVDLTADTHLPVAPAAESLGHGQGHLVAWTSPYTPFFGREEVSLLRTLAAATGLALQRCALLAEERDQRAVLEQATEESERARVEAEQARHQADAANRAKSEFLSRMSHELRTPLNAILGFAQLMESSTLTSQDREGLGHILKAGRHLLALITDVLDLSRVESDRLAVSLEPVHVGGLIDDTVSLMRPLADARSIQVTVASDHTDTWVRTDGQRCRQALLNLLSNAVKYNHDGGEVQVRCRRLDAETLRLMVRDTGPGIDPSRHDDLFEPFDRLGAESTGVEGTGLGLALTKQLIIRLGGAIGVDSVLGEGSTFWLDLPCTVAPSSPDVTTEPAAAPAPAGGQQLLLVEDNVANLRLVEAFLRLRPGISVLPAMQGNLALELAHQHLPDVIVLDLHLPDLSGRDVLARLKADPRTRHIPVIIASADATAGRVRQLHEEGAFAYVTKPLDLHQFLEILDGALDAA